MKYILYLSLFFTCFQVTAQQIAIPRVDQMPDSPNPYIMRDWKKVATDYDNFVFDTGKQGTNLPLVRFGTQGQFNYPDNTPFFLDTYVGTYSHGQQAEAINILPAIVSASLNGIDKSNQGGQNWVSKSKDFFNTKNGQNVYLNNYSVKSGNDWWYDVMPNVYFYQLYTLYPGVDPDFNDQFISIADRWSTAVNQLGGKSHPWTVPYMNYRAFNLETGKPLQTGVPEPEAAGSIAWLLYHAYLQTGNRKYFETAQQSLDFLQNWTTNPSYELQLPYGTLTAAKMNALEGTNYNIEKFVNWSFDRGQLRGWGTIVGNWGGYDVSGLIGEANDNGNDYAFIMNGFQQAGTLVPMVKYDKRFARAIGKWMLNLANASRLMYWDALPQQNQEPQSYAWASANDPNVCIPYESMKQVWNSQSPVAMGDAVKGGWASTNLSLYSGSSAGYMAALIAPTNQSRILQLNLNVTDFFAKDSYPTFLYYNPFPTDKDVSLQLPSGGTYDIYDAISESVIQTNRTNSTTFSVPANNAKLLVIYPSGKTTQTNGRIKTVDGKVIDYHAGYNFDPLFRLKSLSADQSLLETGQSVNLYSLVENVPSGSTVTYSWSVNGNPIPGQQNANLSWTAPNQSGSYSIAVTANAGSSQTQASVKLEVRSQTEIPPSINGISISGSMPLLPSSTSTLQAVVNGTNTNMKYHWSVDRGTLNDSTSASPSWVMPSSAGICTATLRVENDYGNTSQSYDVLVKEDIPGNPAPLIYYSFNGNVNNQAQNAYNGILSGATPTSDARGTANSAYRFITVNDIIYTPNNSALNFTDKVSLGFWVEADALPDFEQFIISHGSWEDRYKVSITPEKKLRWTLKTNNATVDVDNPEPLAPNQFYYFTTIYTGYSMEVYCNGKLTAFARQSGAIGQTNKNITYSKKDNATKDYALTGVIDEVRIYDSDLSQAVIKALPNTWTLNVITGIDHVNTKTLIVYPNPAKEILNISLPDNETLSSAELFDISGKIILRTTQTSISIPAYLNRGFYLLKVKTASGEKFVQKVMIGF